MSSLILCPPLNTIPPFSQNIVIKFQNLQIVSPSEYVKIINVLGHYLRKYGIRYQIILRIIGHFKGPARSYWLHKLYNLHTIKYLIKSCHSINFIKVTSRRNPGNVSQNMWEIFPFVPSKKPLTREN